MSLDDSAPEISLCFLSCAPPRLLEVSVSADGAARGVELLYPKLSSSARAPGLLVADAAGRLGALQPEAASQERWPLQLSKAVCAPLAPGVTMSPVLLLTRPCGGAPSREETAPETALETLVTARSLPGVLRSLAGARLGEPQLEYLIEHCRRLWFPADGARYRVARLASAFPCTDPLELRLLNDGPGQSVQRASTHLQLHYRLETASSPEAHESLCESAAPPPLCAPGQPSAADARLEVVVVDLCAAAAGPPETI